MNTLQPTRGNLGDWSPAAMTDIEEHFGHKPLVRSNQPVRLRADDLKAPQSRGRTDSKDGPAAPAGRN